MTDLPLKRPASAADLASHIAAARSAGHRVRVAGSDSLPLAQFADDAAPVQPISTLRMNKILEFAVPDMTVIAHAGITLEALQRHLAWHNQWLPVDPPAHAGRTPGQRTLGGLIATNSLGPLRLSMGDWRLLVMGMKYVDVNGTLLSGGGRTVKNVAGYSIPRLMIGSAGTLGAIAEVTLRTFARPADEQCLILFCDTPDAAEALLAALLLAPLTPAYVQLVGARTFVGNPLQLPSPRALPGAMALIVGFLGRPDVCAAQIAALRDLPLARPLESISQTAAQAGRLRLWMTTEPAAIEGTPALGFRLHVLSSRVAQTIAAFEQLPDARVWLVSEAATGVIRGSLASGTALAHLTTIADAAQGTFAITQGPAPAAASDPITRRLKEALDPTGCFPALR